MWPVLLHTGVVEHGGQIIYGAQVKHILTEDNEDRPGSRKAVGVKLADGRTFQAKVALLFLLLLHEPTR
jgi:phytoene dehydrogenase-like protein